MAQMGLSHAYNDTGKARAMKICLLTSQDLDADPFPDDDWPCDPRPYLPEADWHVEVLHKATSVRQVRQQAQQGFDVFFNMCDGPSGEDRPGIEVIRALERLNVPFTGATSGFFEPTRARMKRACRQSGIVTPASVLARTAQDVARAASKLRFPLFVKHHNSYASIDLSRMSRVRTPAGLQRQARKIMSRHGAALIEEFVDGDEYTVLVAEHPRRGARPTAYQPIRYQFPPGESFKHSDMKWVDYDSMASTPVADARLDAALRRASARFFTAMDGASFGRCDIRVDAAGTIFMLEINANCGIYYPPADAAGADLCLLHDPAGHRGFTRQIVQAALARHRRRQ